MASTGLKLTELTNEEIVKLAVRETAGRKSDCKAFSELSRRFRPACSTFISNKYVKVFSSEEMEDIVQESMIKAYTGLASYDSRFAFMTWLMRICRNTATDHIRKNKLLATEDYIEPDSEKAATVASPEETMIAAQEEDSFNRMIGILPDSYREVLKLQFEGMDCRQIAEKLSISVANVKTRLYRARQELARMKGQSDGK